MRKFLVQTLGILVLVAGPTYPYIHLAEVPHRYCPIHGTFEKIPYHYDKQGKPVPDKPLGGNEDDEHDKCFIAALTLTGLVTGAPADLLSAGPAQAADVLQVTPAPVRSLDVLRVAPKSSPPQISV